MNWQTIRSCRKRKEVAWSLFSRTHWRKAISPFGFFWTVRIQSGEEKERYLLEWHLREMPKFALLPVCIVLGLLQQTSWPVKNRHIHCLPSGAQDRIFLCITVRHTGAAQPAGSAEMWYKTLHRLFLDWSFREATLIGVAMLSVSLLSPTKGV